MQHSDPTRFVAAGTSHRGHGIALSNSALLPDAAAAARDLGQMAQGARPEANPVYGRLHNDTVADFEDALAGLEHMEAAVAFASGMAAITAVFLAARMVRPTGHVVALRPLYGGTDHLLTSGLLGMPVRFCTAEDLSSTVDEETALVVVETPANPTLDLVDIEAVRRAAGDVPAMVDSTFATPVLQTPARQGATFVVHSASKYLGGHGDVLGGVVATSEKWAARLRQVRIATGAVLHPMAGYLLRRGLSTLSARVLTAQENARRIAAALVEHPDVERVFYPGVDGGDPLGLVGRQMSGPGAMLSFTVTEEVDPAAVMAGVEVILPAVSLGTTDTLIQHPASLTHQIVAPEDREAGGISERLLRVSVGLESTDALIGDLAGALSRAKISREFSGDIGEQSRHTGVSRRRIYPQ